MKVLVVEPGFAPYEKEISGLREMQAIVGGSIQAIYPYEERVAVVCNDEGAINGMDFNRTVPGGYGGVFGTFFICGTGEEDFISLTPDQVTHYKKEFRSAEILLGVKSDDLVTMKVPAAEKNKPPKEKGRDTPPTR